MKPTDEKIISELQTNSFVIRNSAFISTLIQDCKLDRGVFMLNVDKIFLLTLQLLHQHRTATAILTGLFIVSWMYNKFRINRAFFSSKQSMKGKTILITGAASGIGYETAKDLLERGASVVIADYDMKKGSRALQQLRLETGCDEKNIRLMECDLRSFESVRKFVQLYNSEETKLDVLICNAGIPWSPDLITKDGFHPVIQVNYLSHFLLTNLLLNTLKQCRPSRIVYVASGSHRTIRSIDWSDAFSQVNSFQLTTPYAVSKTFMLLFARKLKHELKPNDIDVFAVNPSWVWSCIQAPMREAIGLIPFLICYPILYTLKCLLAKTTKTGARTSVFCAVEPSLQHSRDLYFEDCAVETVSSLCTDDALANRLWDLSCQAVEL